MWAGRCGYLSEFVFFAFEHKESEGRENEEEREGGQNRGAHMVYGSLSCVVASMKWQKAEYQRKTSEKPEQNLNSLV